MKRFKHYLTENTKTYSFKLKVAGEPPENCQELLHAALDKFSIVNISKGKRTPIRDTSVDFPGLSNIEVTIWDIEIKYPTITPVLADVIAKAINAPLANVKVNNLNDPLEQYQNAPIKEPFNTEMTSEEAQEQVGQKRVTGLLKDLVNAARTTGTKYDTVNPNIVAKDCPKEKPMAETLDQQSYSPLGSTKRTFIDPRKGN